MAENSFINKEKNTRPAGGKSWLRFILPALDGTMLSKEGSGRILPFFLFITSLAIVLIFNTYYAEKKARNIEQLRLEITELRVRYITTKSELMLLSNQSEVARRLRDRGFVESTTPPRLINENKGKSKISDQILSWFN